MKYLTSAIMIIIGLLLIAFNFTGISNDLQDLADTRGLSINTSDVFDKSTNKIDPSLIENINIDLEDYDITILQRDVEEITISYYKNLNIDTMGDILSIDDKGIHDSIFDIFKNDVEIIIPTSATVSINIDSSEGTINIENSTMDNITIKDGDSKVNLKNVTSNKFSTDMDNSRLIITDSIIEELDVKSDDAHIHISATLLNIVDFNSEDTNINLDLYYDIDDYNLEFLLRRSNYKLNDRSYNENYYQTSEGSKSITAVLEKSNLNISY